MKISRGARIGGLMAYLVGPGKRNEHTHPHLVAGSPELLAWYSTRELDAEDARAIATATDRARVHHRTAVTVKATAADERRGSVLVEGGRKPAHVWHCSLSLPPTGPGLADRRGLAAEGAGEGGTSGGGGRQLLDDATWEQVATDFVDEMGFTASSGKSPCRWVAVHHGSTASGGDHIHVAVVLVREDGTKASTHQDYRKASVAAARLEAKYGLEEVSGRRVGRAAPGIDLGESIAAGPGAAETYSQRLARKVRASAAVASSEGEFVRACRSSGLVLRPRFAEGSTTEVTGFAVAEPSTTAGEPLVWRAAGKLGRDLTLPRLREAFTHDESSGVEAVGEWRTARGLDATVERRQETAESETAADAAGADPVPWRDRALEVARLREQLRAVPGHDHAAWAEVSHEVAGVLAAWSVATEPIPGRLAAASDAVSRSANLHRRVMPPGRTRTVSLRGPALLVASLAAGAGSRTGQALLLRELLNTMRAINLAMAASRQAREAARLEEAARARLAKVQAGLPTPPALGPELTAQTLRTSDLRHATAPGRTGKSRPAAGAKARGAEVERDRPARPRAPRGRDPGPER